MEKQVAKYSINTLREKMPEDPVKYKSEKNIHYFTIGNTTVIAWKHPTDEKTGLGASASVEGVSAGYASERESDWESFVHLKDLGLMPLDTWKEKIANRLTVETGVSVVPSTVAMSTIIAIPENMAKCPNCNNTLFVTVDGTCMTCHKKIL